MATAPCYICLKELPREEFHSNKARGYHGVNSACKACENARRRGLTLEGKNPLRVSREDLIGLYFAAERACREKADCNGRCCDCHTRKLLAKTKARLFPE